MDIQNLRYLVQIEQIGSINRAAQSLYVSQSTLSRILKEVEAQTGITIFRRTNKGVIPTNDGALFLAKVKKVLADMEKHKNDPQLRHGKQTLRQLMKHNTGVSNIEITDQNIRAFSATAKKYGIDFALKKDTSGEIPRYLVFFKGRDADVITAAFREFSAKNLEKEKKPSIRKELEQAKQQSKAQHRQREKVKTKDRGVEL